MSIFRFYLIYGLFVVPIITGFFSVLGTAIERFQAFAVYRDTRWDGSYMYILTNWNGFPFTECWPNGFQYPGSCLPGSWRSVSWSSWSTRLSQTREWSNRRQEKGRQEKPTMGMLCIRRSTSVPAKSFQVQTFVQQIHLLTPFPSQVPTPSFSNQLPLQKLPLQKPPLWKLCWMLSKTLVKTMKRLRSRRQNWQQMRVQAQ